MHLFGAMTPPILLGLFLFLGGDVFTAHAAHNLRALDDAAVSDGICSSIEEGSRAFTAALLPTVYEGGKSGSFSPTSLRQAWFMAGAGAGESDAVEIRTALRTCSVDIPFKDLAPRVVDLEAQLDHFNLTVGNALFVDQTFAIKEDYKKMLKTWWGALAMSVDFVNKPKKVMKIVNGFVNDKTHGIIPEILQSPPDPNTIMYLVNTLYFAAKWAYKFDKKPTQPQLFVEESGRAVMVQTMSREIRVPFVNATTYTAISLPYEESDYEMLLVRPRGCLLGDPRVPVGLAHLVESDLDETLQEIILRTASTEPTPATVNMPRFRITWRADDMIPTFRSMGLNNVFGSSANFSGITDARPFYVSEIIHQADVLVNEDGTVAAAATVLGFSKSVLKPFSSLQFTLDRPFLYAILHRPTQSILFAGWVRSDALEVTEDVVDHEPPIPEQCMSNEETISAEEMDEPRQSEDPRRNETQPAVEDSSPEDTLSTPDQTTAEGDPSRPEGTESSASTPPTDKARSPDDASSSIEAQTPKYSEDQNASFAPVSSSTPSAALRRNTISVHTFIASALTLAFLTFVLN